MTQQRPSRSYSQPLNCCYTLQQQSDLEGQQGEELLPYALTDRPPHTTSPNDSFLRVGGHEDYDGGKTNGRRMSSRLTDRPRHTFGDGSVGGGGSEGRVGDSNTKHQTCVMGFS
jgi:uncharacterized membrane protein YgcG